MAINPDQMMPGGPGYGGGPRRGVNGKWVILGFALIPVVMFLLWLVTVSPWAPVKWSPPAPQGPGMGSRAADLIFASGDEVDTLDPQGTSWLIDFRVIDCLFEPLLKVKLDEHNTLEGGVAEKWEVSADGKTYTFHLRSAAKWTNGDAVTAKDFIYGWSRAMTPDFAADYSNLFFRIKGAKAFYDFRHKQTAEYVKQADKSVAHGKALWDQAWEFFQKNVGLHAPDDHTLVVELDRPVTYFLELCAFPAFCPVQHDYEKLVTYDQNSGMRTRPAEYFSEPGQIVTNGPYRLAKYRFQQDLLLQANDSYWNRAAMGNRSILIKIISEANTSLLSYQNHEVDWLPDVPSADPLAADLVAQKRQDVHAWPSAGTYYYLFNCLPALPDGSKNPLADVRVRKALSMAIDRKNIVDTVTRLNQPIARSFVPVGCIPGYDPPVDAGLEFDPAAARKLLADAGFPGGKGLPPMSILYNTKAKQETLAEAIQYTWRKELGVDVTLDGEEKSAFREHRRSHAFAVARAGWYGDYRDPSTFLDMFHTGDGNNDGAYSNAQYDQLLNQAENEADPAKRFAILRQAETLLLQDQPLAPIFQYANFWVFDPQRVQGLQLNPWLFRRLELVKVQP